MEAGERGRTLGDYVSAVKMKQVAETCARTHEDLKEGFAATEDALVRLTEGTDGVRSLVADVQCVQFCLSLIRPDALAIVYWKMPSPAYVALKRYLTGYPMLRASSKVRCSYLSSLFMLIPSSTHLRRRRHRRLTQRYVCPPLTLAWQ